MINFRIFLVVLLFIGCKKDTTTPIITNSTYTFEFTFKGQNYSWSGSYPFINGAFNGPNYYPTLSLELPNALIGQYEANPSNGKPTTQNPYPSICGIMLSNLNPSSDVYSAALGNGKVSITITEVGQVGGHIKGKVSGTVCNLNNQSEPISGSFDVYRLN